MDWPVVVQSVTLSVCSVVATEFVRRISRSLRNVATKEFVQQAITSHGEAMLKGISEMFVKTSYQNIVNADIESRVRRVEEAFGVKLSNILRPEKERAG